MIRFAAAAALGLLAMAACAQSNPEAEQAAFEATVPWLELMDAGDYERCWQTAAPLFQDTESLESWVEKAAGYRDPLGRFESRRLNTTSYLVNPWRAPAGEYAVVVYDSYWQAGAIFETVNMQRQKDGSWLVAGYAVQQQ